MAPQEPRVNRQPDRHKRRTFALMLALVAVLLVTVGFVLTREHPLTEHAARVSNITDYCWINNQELLWFGPGPTRLSRIHLQTHAQDFLTDFIKKAQAEKFGAIEYASVSPNGKRLLCSEFDGGSSSYITERRTCIADLHGKRVQLFRNPASSSRGAPFWMPDSRRWLEFTVTGMQTPFSGEDSPPALWLYSLDAPDRRVGPLPFPQGMRSLLGVTPDYRMVASNLPPGVDQPMLILFEAGLYPNIQPERHSVQNPPVGWFFRSAVLSPQGDRVACLLTTAQVPPLLAFLARIAPSLVKPGKPSRIFQIRTCRTDGTHIRDIGFQDTGPDGTTTLDKLQWTPDGKRLSFVFKGSLYIVPTE